MIRIDNRMYLKVVFDGTELPIENCVFSHLQMNSHEKLGLPCGQLVLGDPNKYFRSTIKLAQGVPVSVFLGETPEKFKEYKMSVFSFVNKEQHGTIYYVITLIYNTPTYYKESAIKTFKGTSSDAIKNIASICGLKYTVDICKDNQTWVPANKTYFKWAIDISKKGYISDTSCMMLGVTFEGYIRYKDILKLTDEVKKQAVGFYMGQPIEGRKSYMFWGKKFIDRSGHATGVGATKMITQDQAHAGTSDVHDKVKLTRKTESSVVETPANKKVTRSRVDVAPIGSGNGHPKITTAKHQNARFKLLHTNKLQIAVLNMCEVDLFDIVYVSITDIGVATGRPELNAEQSGYYVVTGKTIYISHEGLYVEKYDLLREGNN